MSTTAVKELNKARVSSDTLADALAKHSTVPDRPKNTSVESVGWKKHNLGESGWKRRSKYGGVYAVDI
ncbi:hypothetical protein ColTof4_00075 [Colletotrichum tofieldiae]|nr:hypothetical protein ColTof3_07273 [Colletotrichum tofieldiae]GKT67652.1 hypothetical protein ColTof4_00075 [Colletotrichum tofieldiae]GKT91395.1 hypothetical protein Ct61P_09245 [Colletotrichum tofieldiae]